MQTKTLWVVMFLSFAACAVRITDKNNPGPTNSQKKNQNIDNTVRTGQGPTLSSFSPSLVAFGDMLTLAGNNFGSIQGSGSVTIGGVSATVLSWSNATITVRVPGGARSDTSG